MSTFSEWLSGLDARFARSAQARFEARTGCLASSPTGARLVDVPSLVASIGVGQRGAGRTRIVHHWATWCESCVEELPLIQRLADAAARGAGRVEVVTVSWELFEDQRPAATVVGEIERFLHAHGLTFPVLVFDGEPAALFQACQLSMHQIPQTAVLDADGGRLREFDGPLSEADVDAILDLVAPGPSRPTLASTRGPTPR